MHGNVPILGIYNVEIDKGWVNASKRAVEYTMDPRNFLIYWILVPCPNWDR